MKWRAAALVASVGLVAFAAAADVPAAAAPAPAVDEPAAAKESLPPVIPADLPTLLDVIRKPGASAVLVTVWASWCDPCRQEMPHLLRFYRQHQAEGLRLVLVSIDDEAKRDRAARFLASKGVDFPSWLKRGDDMPFIDAFERTWTGEIPASFLYDGRGRRRGFWQGEVSPDELERAVGDLRVPEPATPNAKSSSKGKTKAATKAATKTATKTETKTARRKP